MCGLRRETGTEKKGEEEKVVQAGPRPGTEGPLVSV